MEKPKTYLDRIGGGSDKYVFISYSHKDCDEVFECLNRIYDAGANYWYDAELIDGDVWNEEVQSILQSDNCTGIIFFISRNSLASTAVFREFDLALEKLGSGKKFQVLPVFIGYEDYGKALVALCGTDYRTYVSSFISIMKNGDRLYLRLSDADSVGRIADFCSDNGAACGSGQFEIRGTNYMLRDGGKLREYSLGEYPQSDGEKAVPIVWDMFSRDKNLLYFVSRYCLDFIDYSAIEDIEAKKFGIEGDESVVGLRLIEKSLIDKFGEVIGPAVPTDYADSRRTQSLRAFWVKDGSGNLLLYNSTNRPLTGYVNFENNQFTAGIRLVLVLDDDKINRRK